MELLEYESLMRKLRDKRRRLGTEQREVAQRAGVSPAQLSRMERGKADAKYATVFRVWQTLRELETERAETAADLCAEDICWVTTGETGRDARRKLLTHDYSQLPVRDQADDAGRAVGSVTERDLLSAATLDTPIRDLMGPPFVEIPPETGRDAVTELLRDGADALLVRSSVEGYAGIVTPADLV